MKYLNLNSLDWIFLFDLNWETQPHYQYIMPALLEHSKCYKYMISIVNSLSVIKVERILHGVFYSAWAHVTQMKFHLTLTCVDVTAGWQLALSNLVDVTAGWQLAWSDLVDVTAWWQLAWSDLVTSSKITTNACIKFVTD